MNPIDIPANSMVALKIIDDASCWSPVDDHSREEDCGKGLVPPQAAMCSDVQRVWSQFGVLQEAVVCISSSCIISSGELIEF